jgi:hypothetical protein
MLHVDFELDFGLALRDFDFDVTKPIFRNVTIPSLGIARAITIPSISY